MSIASNGPLAPMHEIVALLHAERPHDAHLRYALLLRAMPDQEAVQQTLKHLAERHPNDPLIPLLLIQARGWAGQVALAEQELNMLLGKENGPVLEQVQRRILLANGAPGDPITSHYTCFPASMVQNLGFWIHQLSNPSGAPRELITKIMHRDHCGREVDFYSRIRPAHPALDHISPAPIDVTVVEHCGVVLLTLERVAGQILDPGAMDAGAIAAFVQDYAPIASITYGAVTDLLQDRTTENGLSHGYLASALHLVHTRAGFEQTVEWTRKTVAERGYRTDVVDLVIRAMDHLVRINFHAAVVPEQHYALLHGDMHRHNVLSSLDRTVLIDWARCTTGPRGIDLAVLFRRFGHQRVHTLMESIMAIDPVTEVLIAWALIIVSLELDLQGIKDEPPAHLFTPAATAVLGFVR